MDPHMKSLSTSTSRAQSIGQILYTVFVILVFLLSMLFLYYGMTTTDWHDFDVFYAAAKAALLGQSIYVVTGKFNLPFWYFPWTAWLFIPFAVWPRSVALILYKICLVICAILGVNSLLAYYNSKFKLLDRVLLISLIIPMSWQVLIVGQMEFILLALVILTIYSIEKGNMWTAGLVFPFLWTKPHLLVIFTLMAFWRGGKRLVAVSAGASIAMLLLETLLSPGWYLDMWNLLKAGQNRTEGLKFTTLPSLLGGQENWVGTGNLPITILLIAIALVAVWSVRRLPTVPLLSLSLAASLFCAPRAYAYDLPLLIPAMIWLTAKEFRSNLWIWIVAAVLPPLFRFSSAAYLVTLLVFVLGIAKARLENKLSNGQVFKEA